MKMFAKFSIVLCLTLSFGLTLSGAQEGPTADEPLTLFPAYLQTPLGQPVILEAETYPEGMKLNWTSLDPSVAAVDPDGCVTPVAAGETYVICAFADNSGIAASCGVRVTEGGNMFFWEYAPEPEDLDAAIAAMERTNTAEEIDIPDIPWPAEWPGELPKLEGSVAHAQEGLESEQGLIVYVIVEGRDAVERYVSLMISSGLKKGMEFAGDDSYVIQLDGKGYKVMIAYQDSEKGCSLIVKK